jgi:hypothetical protein
MFMVDSRQPPDPWFSATWEGAALSKLLAGAQLSLEEKLAWLQDVSRFYRAIGGDKVLGATKAASSTKDEDS